ncbi:hypothetical protein OSTOST_00528 [Ostertagia ostertagi]
MTDTEKVPMATAYNSYYDQHKQTESNSIKPPTVTIPHFFREISNFQEYWAIYNAMVHKNSSLNTMEKIISFKRNYQRMVDTILKKYSNVTNVRANVTKELSSLPAAKNNAKSCDAVFDNIRALVNEMTSSGFTVVNICDPMWIETILKKLLCQIAEGFLREN